MGETTEEICKKILNDTPDFEIFKERRVDSKILLLVKGMLIKEPSKRLTIRQVMAHELFQFLEKEEQKVHLKLF